MNSAPYLALRHRDFRRMWLSQIVSVAGSYMQFATVDWHIYVLTRSPLFLGLTGLARILPVILFSLWGGLASDRFERRWIMFGSQWVMAVTALGLGALTLGNAAPVWSIYALTALGAAANAFDSPARQALVTQLVPRQELPAAVALNLTMLHIGTIVGPLLSGLVIGVLDLEGSPAPLGWIYVGNAFSFVGVLWALLRLKVQTPQEKKATVDNSVRSLLAGFRFVFGHPLLLWTMLLDFFATFFSGATSLLPIFADQILNVGARGFGWLRAAPALGALFGSLLTNLRPLPPKQGYVLLFSVFGYGLATCLFGLSRNYALTFGALCLIGFSDAISTVVRQVLRQLATPDDMRGRMLGINMIFFMGGPQLGELEAGLVASLFAIPAVGATFSVVSGGVFTILIGLCIGTLRPVVRRYDIGAFEPPSTT